MNRALWLGRHTFISAGEINFDIPADDDVCLFLQADFWIGCLGRSVRL
jgi:hypothetical protein